jgi:flagellar biogenesis protein FliO
MGLDREARWRRTFVLVSVFCVLAVIIVMIFVVLRFSHE